MKSDTLAAIDLGSNAVRLLINHVLFEENSYEMKKIAYLRVPIRLGEDVFTTGRVSEEKAEKLLSAFKGFQEIMRAYGVSEVRVCATSAMREAENGQALSLGIKQATGIAIETISGQEEADLVYAASSTCAMPGGNELALYVDVGGGSTELVLYRDDVLVVHESFRIGTIRLLHCPGIAREMEKEKDRLAQCLAELYALHAPRIVVASGGNINKIHKMLAKKKAEPLYLADLQQLYETLKPLGNDERMRAFGLNYYRADVIVPALEIFLRLCGCCPSVSAIYVPKAGLSDGLIHAMCKKRLSP